MKRTFMSMVAALAITLLPGVRVVAEEITFASHSEIMSVLERQNTRIAELEAALANGGGGCSSCDSGCGNSCCDSCCDTCSGCCDGCCDPCCRPSGIIGGAEILFVKPHHNQGIGGIVDDFKYGYETAPRIWAGYQGSDGMGWRLRYFEFNHGANDGVAIPGVAVTDGVNYDTYVVDLEFVDSMSLGCAWDASVFGGFRYLEFDETRRLTGTVLGANVLDIQRDYDFSGYGLTIGAELRRCIGNGLAGFFNSRASLIMGDQGERAQIGVGAGIIAPGPVVAAATVERFDEIKYIWEAQSGVQWTRELESGGYLFARAAGEVQFWDNMAMDRFVPFFGDPQSWALGGVTLSAGIIR